MTTSDLHSRRVAPSFTLPKARRSPAGLLVSLLVHVAIIALVAGGLVGGRQVLRGLGTGFGPGPAGGGGGGGGSRVAYIELPPLGASAPKAAEKTSQSEVAPPPVETAPEPTPVPPPVAPAAVPLAAASGINAAVPKGDGIGTGAGTDNGTGGSGGGTGGGVGPGKGTGVGPGTGGDSSSVTPPTLRYWVPPTERAPKDLRGRPLEVTFWIKADGSVERFETDPEIEDRKYREQFADLVMKTRFRPARTRAGVAVPAVVTMQFTLTTE